MPGAASSQLGTLGKTILAVISLDCQHVYEQHLESQSLLHCV